MTTVHATVEQAARWALADSTAVSALHPVYRALLEDPEPSAQNAPGPAAGELVTGQLTAPALLVLAIADGSTTRRLRLRADPDAGTVETSQDSGPSHWSALARQRMPETLTAFLEESGIGAGLAPEKSAPESEALRLTPSQNRIVRAALERGLAPADAYASVPDLDPRLHDALTATGTRIAVSLTLHDPQHRLLEQPATRSLLWVRGRRGLYRLEGAAAPGGSIREVGEEDLARTLLAALEEGLRFTTAQAESGRAR